MTTQFFQRQEDARTRTTYLVLLFAIAVLGLVSAAFAGGYAVGLIIEFFGNTSNAPPIAPMALGIAFGSVAGGVIALGSIYQINVLSVGGGSGLAESIGGRALIINSANSQERQLLNIVEEMAIASGTPMPPVYILNEPGINAFAAGFEPSDAVLGVTRGAIEMLDREKLQGIIAHEFSHVLNGDMRLNIRMIGILHGILFGKSLFELIYTIDVKSHESRNSRNDDEDQKDNGGAAAAMLLCLPLYFFSWFGSLMCDLIKAAVCRQREYLADASAVQFTRNPNGIAGALRQIGSLPIHGRLRNPHAWVASHLFFTRAIYENLNELFSAHPPIAKRILAIDPNWDGDFFSATPISLTQFKVNSKNSDLPAAVLQFSSGKADEDVPAAIVGNAALHIGTPKVFHHQYSAALLASIDRELKTAAGEPYSARAIVFALLLDRDLSIAELQIDSLRKTMPPHIVALTERLASRVAAAPEAIRLPLVDLALPMLRRMSLPQYQQFMLAFDSLICTDSRLSLFEWALSQVVSRNLRSQYTRTASVKTHHQNLANFSEEVSILLTMLSRAGHAEKHVAGAFQIAAKQFPKVQLRLLPIKECSFQLLEAALKKLRRVSERQRGELLEACAASVVADRTVRVREAELLRGIADLLECPMPPLIAG